MDGILNIYKEVDYTSHDVVARLRGILHQKKIGHTGTLDPAAVGVLPVCLGSATKVAGMLTDTDKAYRVRMRLGVETDTQDMTGRVVRSCPVEVDEARVRGAVASMVGEIDQIPPMYSAIKINGQRLYKLARQGQEVERGARRIHIHGIEIHHIELPFVEMTVSCSKGTYIRTICHDIGQSLGCGAAMEKLARVRSGRFTIDKSLRIDEVEALAREGRIAEAITPVEEMFSELPANYCTEEADRKLKNGAWLSESDLTRNRAEKIRVYDSGGRFCAVYGFDETSGCYKPVKMFLPEG